MDPNRQALVARYGGPAPRYTSFPTANHFRPLGAGVVEDALASSGPDYRVYVHTPYCQRLCWYCGCNTVVRRDPAVGEIHVDRVLAELDLLRAHLPDVRRIRNLDLGGGTPNFLRPAALRRLVGGIERVFEPVDPEYATELDPRTVSNEQLATFLDLGFQRFSLGVQTLEPAVQKAVNRDMPRERVGDIAQVLRKGGATSINFDLMVGLPHQDADTMDRTLATVLDIRPDRLAVFQYAHIPRLRPAQKHLERAGLPGPMERDGLMQHVIERLVEAGYQRIGFDHFALPSDSMAIAAREGVLGRDFQGFTTDDHRDLVALGPSAIGRIGQLFTQNERSPETWAAHLERGQLPILRGWEKTDDDERYGRLIHAILCRGRAEWDEVGVPHTEVAERLTALEPFEADGLVTVDPVAIEVLPAGLDFVRQIAAVFDPYLERPELHSSVA